MRESSRFRVRQWADGCAVFDRQFGDTHTFDTAAFAIFMAIENGESSRPVLLEKFSLFYPELSVEELDEQFDDVLSHLQRLRLTKVDLN